MAGVRRRSVELKLRDVLGSKTRLTLSCSVIKCTTAIAGYISPKLSMLKNLKKVIRRIRELSHVDTYHFFTGRVTALFMYFWEPSNQHKSGEIFYSLWDEGTLFTRHLVSLWKNDGRYPLHSDRENCL